MKIKTKIENKIKSFSNLHFPSDSNVMIFSIPRSGSTWLMELIWTQPEFKTCNEPLNIRNPKVQEALNIVTWEELYENKEKVLQYFNRINNGKHGALNPSPFRRQYKPLTKRIVYKVINGGELWINELATVTNSQIIYLIRHPFSVAISRKVLPRLDVLCSEKILAYFNPEIRELAKNILLNGSYIEKAILSWCIQNKLALNKRNEHWLVITYEQLLVEPEPIINLLADKLKLPKPDRMKKAIRTPSAVTIQSNKGTSAKIVRGDWGLILNNWKTKIPVSEEESLQRILKTFELEIYDPETFYPIPEYIIL